MFFRTVNIKTCVQKQLQLVITDVRLFDWGILGQKNFSKSTSTREKEILKFMWTQTLFLPLYVKLLRWHIQAAAFSFYSASWFLWWNEHLWGGEGGQRNECTEEEKLTVNLDGKQRSSLQTFVAANISNQHIFDSDENFSCCKSYSRCYAGWNEEKFYKLEQIKSKQTKDEVTDRTFYEVRKIWLAHTLDGCWGVCLQRRFVWTLSKFVMWKLLWRHGQYF